MKKRIKKALLKLPPVYRSVNRIRNRLRGINPERDGVAGGELNFLLHHMGKNKIVMEIGVFGGETTKDLAKNNFVIAIDPFLPDDKDGTLQGEYPLDVYLRFMKNTVGKKIMFFPLTSEDAFNFWDKFIKKKMIDSIFIDGLHTYEGVKTDFKWTKYLKNGGIVAFHDTHMEGVKRFVDENVFKNSRYTFLGQYGEIGALKVFKKVN